MGHIFQAIAPAVPLLSAFLPPPFDIIVPIASTAASFGERLSEGGGGPGGGGGAAPYAGPSAPASQAPSSLSPSAAAMTAMRTPAATSSAARVAATGGMLGRDQPGATTGFMGNIGGGGEDQDLARMALIRMFGAGPYNA